MQTSVSSTPEKGLPGGQVDADDPIDADSFRVAESGGIAPGLAVVRAVSSGSPVDGAARKAPAFVADDDAIIASHATVAAPTTISGAGLDGVIGQGRIYPPSLVEVVIGGTVADVAAGDWKMVYEDADGVLREDYFTSVLNAGGTFVSKYFVSRFISLFQPTQDGATATFKVGTTTRRAIGKRDGLGISMHSHKALEVTPASSDNEVYEDKSTMPVGKKGKFWVTVENAFLAGDAPFVRCTATGGEVAGAIRVTDTDSGDCAQLLHARLLTGGSAAGLGQLEVDL